MDEIVKLNVGGYIYTTSRSTLTRYPNSMLGAMFSGRMRTSTDREGNFWIDGNGEMFRYVLDFLRRSRLLVPDDFQDFELLSCEVDFYQIPELIKAVKDKCSKRECSNKSQYDDEKQTLIVVECDLQYPKSGCLCIYGPGEDIFELSYCLSRYPGPTHKQRKLSFKPSDAKIVIHYFEADIIPQPAIMQEILNLGFKKHDATGDASMPQAEAYTENKKCMWFVRDKTKSIIYRARASVKWY